MVDLKSMTVIALRQYAKENKITLGTGLSKSEIIDKIQAALGSDNEQNSFLESPSISSPVNEPGEDMFEEDEDEDEEDATEDSSDYGKKVPPIKPGPHNDIVYSTKPAWQARSAPAPKGARPYVAPESGWSPASSPSRFGPATTTPNRFGPATATASPSARFGPSVQSQSTTAQSPSPSPRSQMAAPSRQDEAARNSAPSSSQTAGKNWQPPKSVAGPTPSFSELTVSELLGDGKGILEVLPDGFGFLRDDTFSSTPKDIYVSNAQIKRFSLRTGDLIEGRVRLQKEGERYSALLYITSINGQPAEEQDQSDFQTLTAIYPNRIIPLKKSFSSPFAKTYSLSTLFAPIGFGQRALVVINQNLSSASLFIEYANMLDLSNQDNSALLAVAFNRSPEDCTELKNYFEGESFISSFTQTPDVHIRMAELALGRAQRLTEKGKDVIMIVDNIGALTAAYQALSMQNIRGSAMSLAPSALNRTLHFFGSARNTAEGGSLTIIASYYHSQSELDDHMVKELSFAANSCLYTDYIHENNSLDLDYLKSFTRKNDLLLDQKTFLLLKGFLNKASGVSKEDVNAFLKSVISSSSSIKDMKDKIAAWSGK